MRRALFIFITLLVVGLSCNSKKEGIASDKNFYYSIQSPSSNPTAQVHARYLASHIPQYKYAITNTSGYIWPFYQEFEIEESVLVDSLMPPHWFAHKMIPMSNPQKEIQNGEYFVQIDLYTQSDTLPNYSVTIFKMEKDSLQLSATSGIHYVQPSEYTNEDELSTLLLESVIRYSFK